MAVEDIKPTPEALWNASPFKTAKLLIETFSTRSRRRDPPHSKNRHILFISIGASHYCEKVRWILDLLERDILSPYYYTENSHPPLFQSIETLAATNSKVSMVPMVVFENIDKKLQILHDSKEIVQFLSPRLYPEPFRETIQDFEVFVGKSIGAASRLYMYHHMLQKEYHDTLSRIMTETTSTVEKFLWTNFLDKGLATGMRKAMRISSQTASDSLIEIRSAFVSISKQLQKRDGTKKTYLMERGDDSDKTCENIGFTAADLTFASLASILIHPPELSHIVPINDDKMPPELVKLKKELRRTLAGQHVLEMYRKHRGNVELRTVDRDVFIPSSIKNFVISKL
ncbi:hypothetical protein CTEN210_02411 [Chaetoceros tenuissimus]|uniref:GST N-terminal domain-containing protein n=1 Tax=Chaetoceros tenuissimus TaxID=426638 RepID=A0AAD3CH10_9STRA|nr:hypothetical protein CTEN210_02411 [Chaetoceros tenuissimus]